MRELIRVSNLGFTYPDGTKLVFDGQDFTVGECERVCILGPNGSGKSTLLQLLLGLLKASDGQINVLGIDPAKDYDRVRERIGALLQNVDLQIIAPKVWDDVAFSPGNYGYPREEIAALVDDILEKLEITHLRDKVPHYLSGGERTKVAIAGALVTKPELLILDEPFEHIDPTCRHELINLLNSINRKNGTAILLSTHNMNTVPLIADTVYLISEGGRIISKGNPSEVFSQLENLSRCHIEPPVLGTLFSELKNHGIDMDLTLDVKEAAGMIADRVVKSKSGTTGK